MQGVSDSRGPSSLGALIKQAGLTREHVAETLGVSVQTVHNWSQRRNAPSPRHLNQLADLFIAGGIRPARVKEFLLHELEAQGLDPRRLVEAQASGASDIPSLGESTAPIVIIVWRMAGNPMASMVAAACRLTLEHFGHRCLLMECGANRGFAIEATRAAVCLKAKGVVLFIPGTLPDPQSELMQLATLLIGEGSAIVFGQFWNDASKLPTEAAAVRWDSQAIAKIAINALAEKGHTKVGAVLGGTEATESAIGNWFVRYAEEKNMAAGIARTSYLSSMMDDIRTVAEKSTALFVDSPSILASVGHVLHDMRLRWPSDISVLGVGHAASMPRLGEHPFTTINVPLQEMGQRAAQLVVSLLEHSHLPREKRYVVFGEETMSIVGMEDGSLGPPGPDPFSVPVGV